MSFLVFHASSCCRDNRKYIKKYRYFNSGPDFSKKINSVFHIPRLYIYKSLSPFAIRA